MSHVQKEMGISEILHCCCCCNCCFL